MDNDNHKPTVVTGPYQPPQAPATPPAPLRPIRPRPPKKPRREGWRSVVSTIAILLIAPLFALFLITFVFQSYLVDGPSMETTLQDRDRLIVWKVSRTWANITGNDYIPKRGDVVVFNEPKLNDKQLIKRVIALPGERVVVDEGILTVYNDEHPDGFQPDKTLPYGEAINDTPGDVDVTVPKGHLFVAGDNRSNSLDSRDLGPIPADHIVGKLIARFLPLGEAKRF